MIRFTKSIKILLALVFTFSSLVNTSFFTVQSAKASDGECPNPNTNIATKLALYSTDRSDYLRPDASLDPQSLSIGQTSVRMEVELEDANSCPVEASATTHFTLSTVESGIVNFLTPGKVDKGTTYSYYISKNSARAGFYVVANKPVSLGSIIVTQTDTPQTVINGVVNVNITTIVPDRNLVSFTNNIHGISDTLKGEIGAVPAVSTPGVKVRAYIDAAGTIQLGSDAIVAADGSFPAINIGDDQYRNITLRAVYPGTPEILSDVVLVGEPIISYPSIASGFRVMHDSVTDQPRLTWNDGGVGVSYAIYRKAYSVPASFSDADIVDTTLTTQYLDSTAVIGQRYNYLVKQVISGSYTPEFLPLKNIRIDVAEISITPTSINVGSVIKTPTVTATITPDLAALYATNSESVEVYYNNPDTGDKTFHATIAVLGSVLTATSPFIDAATGLSTSTLSDGEFSVFIETNGVLPNGDVINDFVQNSYTILVDLNAPTAPILSKLRYDATTKVLQGFADAVEVESDIYIYDQNPELNPTATSIIVPFQGDEFGGFISLPLIFTSNSLYIRCQDLLGNVGATTRFDIVPNAPKANNLSIQQNKPGTNDVIVGAAGTVNGGVIVEIYNVDPLLNPTAIPYRSFVANADGSFSQEVGDNTYATFWLAVRSGSGLLSGAFKLTNAISINPVSAFNATVGDGVVKLNWTSNPNTSYYVIDIYDETSAKRFSTVTIASGQTNLQLSLQNSHRYRFSIVSFDLYGNYSGANIVYGTPSAPVITLASSTTIKKVASNIPAASSDSKISSDENLTVTVPTPAPSTPIEDNNRNWAPWILTIGILILLIAGGVAYLLWGKQTEDQPAATARVVETGVVQEIEEKAEKTATAKINAKEELKKPKPRW
jgi:hypothetical protein